MRVQKINKNVSNVYVSSFLTPCVVPFRRAAVRFWDARQAVGRVIATSRANIATVSVVLAAPIRRRRMKQMMQENTPRQQCNDEIATDDKHIPQTVKTLDGEEANPSNSLVHKAGTEVEEDEDKKVYTLLSEYARWLSVLPISIDFFIRPRTRPNWTKDALYNKKRFEIGPLLSDEDANHVLLEFENDMRQPQFDPSDGVRVREAPLVVLNRLHELAYDIAFVSHANEDATRYEPTPHGVLYQQINDQVNILIETYGTMERIKNTPLPFVYAVHLRTFLLLYLLLWNMSSVAKYGWLALPVLFAANWSLIGLEAAAVECESPFYWNRNHLPLGKMSKVVAMNVGQALKEVRWSPAKST